MENFNIGVRHQLVNCIRYIEVFNVICSIEIKNYSDENLEIEFSDKNVLLT